jgi:hypothetical protein
MSAKIKIVRAYRDLELGRFVVEAELLEVSDERAEVLVSKGFAKIIEIKEDVVEKQEKLEVKTKELKTSKKTK